MGIRLHRLLSSLALGALLTGAVFASDTDTLRSELSDFKARTAAADAAMMAPAGGGDAASLTSIKKRASIEIGGDVNIDVILKERDEASDDSDQVTSTEFHTNSANLRMKVNASQDVYLYLKLDLDDNWDESADQDDLLEECKYVWNNIGCSNFGLVFGKGEVPYGQDRTLGIIQSYHHNDTASGYADDGPVFILSASEESDDPLNPHSTVGSVAKPGEVDNVFMISGNYTYRDILKVEATIFQNNDSTGNGSMTRGMHEDRSDDHLGFQSFALRFWAMPAEGLTLELSFINEHCDSASDNANGKADQFAMSFGFQYAFVQVPIEIFGEYEHGWNWNYNEDYKVSIYQLGLVWGITEALDLGMMLEYLDIDNNGTEESYTKLVLSGRYNFENGIYFITEYGHEWYCGDSGSDDREGDLLAFRVGWAF